MLQRGLIMIIEYKEWRKRIDVPISYDMRTQRVIEDCLKKGFKAGWQKCAQSSSRVKN